MSVLKAKRHESKAEYVNVADQIFVETMEFMARMSFRYQRILAADTMKLASEVLDHAEKANSIKVTDETSFKIRRAHLLEARAAVVALDVHMTHVWMILMTNPQGCFTNTKGETVPPKKAQGILDGMAESLGEKIDSFKGLCGGVMQSDRKRFESKEEGCSSA